MKNIVLIIGFILAFTACKKDGPFTDNCYVECERIRYDVMFTDTMVSVPVDSNPVNSGLVILPCTYSGLVYFSDGIDTIRDSNDTLILRYTFTRCENK